MRKNGSRACTGNTVCALVPPVVFLNAEPFYCGSVKIYAQDLKALEKMLNDIKALGGVGRVKTLTVLSNVKDSYSTDIIL